MILPFVALVTAWAVSLGGMQMALPHLRRLNLGQSIRSEGPKTHRKKAGTPTMGGVIFLGASLVVSLFFAPRTVAFWSVALAALGFGSLGFLDDFLKVVLRSTLGLRARYKLLGQALLASILVAIALNTGTDTLVEVPFLHVALNLGFFYPVFGALLIIGFANAVNLTDGLDGLAAGTSTLAFLTYTVICGYLGYPDLAVSSACMAGGLAGFLRFNRYPACVFMGDTGALALGGALGALAVFTKTELFLVIVGGVFVLETLSVMVQVACFRLTGRRILRMSPLHHHFELGGHKEPAVVAGFWVAGVVMGALGILALSGLLT